MNGGTLIPTIPTAPFSSSSSIPSPHKGKIILEGNRKATVLRYTQPEGAFGQCYDFRTFQGVLMTSPEAIYQKEKLVPSAATMQPCSKTL